MSRFFSYLCHKQIYQHILHRYHGIRRNRLQNNARDERHLRTRRLAAPGRSVRDERRLVRTQNLRDVLQQARRRRPAERGCRLHRLGQHRVARIQRPLVHRHPHGASNPSRPNPPPRCPTCRPFPKSPHTPLPRQKWTTCRSKTGRHHTQRRPERFPAAVALYA